MFNKYMVNEQIGEVSTTANLKMRFERQIKTDNRKQTLVIFRELELT